jgi:hypothetical protein
MLLKRSFIVVLPLVSCGASGSVVHAGAKPGEVKDLTPTTRLRNLAQRYLNFAIANRNLTKALFEPLSSRRRRNARLASPRASAWRRGLSACRKNGWSANSTNSC